MRYTQPSLIIVALVPLLAIALLAGCSQPVEAEVVTNSSRYAGVLSTAYDDAPDVASQLALGTLRLEGTAVAVTDRQSAALLPLWQALAGSELQGSAERNAVLMQIEATMTADQMASIAALQLTDQDAQSWAGSQGPSAAAADGQRATDEAKRPSVEEMSEMRTQLGGGSAAGRASYGLVRTVVELLAERSGGSLGEAMAVETEPVADEPMSTTEAAATSESTAPSASTREAELAAHVEPTAEIEAAGQVELAAAKEPDNTPEPTPDPATSEVSVEEQVTVVVQAGDTVAAIARAYGVTVEEIAAASGLLDADMIAVGQELTIPGPAQMPSSASATAEALSESGAGTAVQRLPGLQQIADTNPGPPFTVEISANYAIQDPVVEQSRTYVVTGIVRNDGDETYAVSDILVTFYDAAGFRGTFSPAIRDGKLVGGEWHWHGETEAEFAAFLLAPGEEWPFSVQITAQDMASFLIHPDAAPSGRESAPVVLSDVQVVDQGTGYLQIIGAATNVNPFEVKNVTVSSVLMDASGQIVSLGSTYVLQQDIAPSASVRFDMRVGKTPYVDYQLYAQAERDW